MIPEVKLLVLDTRWGSNSYRSYHDKDYNGDAIIEFGSADKLRKFINEGHKLIISNSTTFKIVKRGKSRATKFYCEVEALTLRNYNLEILGI
jgi:hypothetical protein